MIRDMFGHDVTDAVRARLEAPLTGKKRRKDPIPRGHVSAPGTGPEGERCGTCFHLYRNEMAKVYLKCGLNLANWTGGRASDIRAKDPACRHWKPQEPSKE
jgi:hypothetical protein